MVDLVRAGCSPEALANEFVPTGQAIRNWVKQDDLDQGKREDGLTTKDRTELIDRRCYATNTEARLALFEYIEGFFHPQTTLIPRVVLTCKLLKETHENCLNPKSLTVRENGVTSKCARPYHWEASFPY